MDAFWTTLEALRKWDTWQDSGQTGEKPHWTDRTDVLVHEDGTLELEGWGFLDVDPEIRGWKEFLASLEPER